MEPSNRLRHRWGSWWRRRALTVPDSAAASRLPPSSPQHGQDAGLEPDSGGAAATSPPSPPDEPVRVGVAAPHLPSPLEPDFAGTAATSPPSSPEPDFAGAAATPPPEYDPVVALVLPSPPAPPESVISSPPPSPPSVVLNHPPESVALVLPSPPAPPESVLSLPPPSIVLNHPPVCVDQSRFKLLSLGCAEDVPSASDSSAGYTYYSYDFLERQCERYLSLFLRPCLHPLPITSFFLLHWSLLLSLASFLQLLAHFRHVADSNDGQNSSEEGAVVRQHM
jgi:hypothetical protein